MRGWKWGRGEDRETNRESNTIFCSHNNWYSLAQVAAVLMTVIILYFAVIITGTLLHKLQQY